MTVTYDDAPQGVQWLKITDYADHVGKGRRTITRAIAEGRLPEARQDPNDRVWYIPADAVVRPAKGPQERTLDEGNVVLLGPAPNLPVVRHGATAVDVPVNTPTTLDVLDHLPAWIPLRDAARLLGVPADLITDEPDRFGAERVGRRHGVEGIRALMVPQVTIRKTIGRVGA